MNRIEQIKERVRTYHYHNETEDAGDDIFYLICLLEIAEKELQYVLERDGYMAVKEALDKIRAYK